MSHMPEKNYVVRIGERGRVVLPAAVRNDLHLDEGVEMLLYLDEPNVLRLMKARDVAMAGRGLFADGSRRSLVDELLEERRAEAEREAESLAAH